mmetsp:Transcript_33905/g.58234  ORF Transcript_33905/g.58234 Transcript_33905/m.58234 type:complete len:253 (-) Transcript_33905:104-862(-)
MDDCHSTQLLKDAFGDQTVYEILSVPKDADEDTVKRAYRKLALKHHPDKGGDAKKFQALSLAHSILSDPEKRKIYDQTGDLDGEDSNQDFDTWYQYFRDLFPKITVADIEKFSETYVGSEEEVTDVVAAYEQHSGDLKKIMECVILAEDGDEPRICGIIDAAIERKELTSTKKYKATRVSPEDAKKKRRRPNKKAREESLEQLILSKSNRTTTSATFNNIFEKYGGKEAKEVDIPDDEFEALRKNVTKKSRK